MAHTRARWAEDVPDLTGNLSEVPKYMNVNEVSAATGLSPNTIEDALSRPPITKPNNPLAPLSRPAGRIGNTPLWLPDQVERAKALQRVTVGHRHLGGGSTPLPLMDADVADERGLVSTEEIAAMTHMRTGSKGSLKSVHEQTVRRWARDNGAFPAPVALRARSQGHPGVPIVVYDGDEVVRFLKGFLTGRREGRVVLDAVPHLRDALRANRQKQPA